MSGLRILAALFLSFIMALLGALIYKPAMAWSAPITCPGAAEVIPAVIVSHPLPERTDYTPELTCVMPDGTRRVASNGLLLATCMAYAFIPALALTFVASRLWNRIPATPTAPTPTSIAPTIEPETPGVTTVDLGEGYGGGRGSRDLARRLKELTDARNAGLITDAEFEDKKAEMLKEL